ADTGLRTIRTSCGTQESSPMSAPDTPDLAPPIASDPENVADLPGIVDDLAYAFDGTFARDEVEGAVRTAWTELAAVSRVPTYLPVLTQRLARERLTAAAQADGRVVKTVPELLFVCVHNA